MTVLLLSLLLFMIIAAVIALYTEELISAVIAAGAVGFGSSAVFLLLRAPDLAITQIVVEVIALVLLIRTTLHLSGRGVGEGPSGPRVRAAGLFCLAVLVSVLFALPRLPRFGEPVMDRIAAAPSGFYLERGLELTGSANLVTAILLDFRAYDTLGEATIIFTAVLGALTLLSRKCLTSCPAGREEEGER